MLTIDGAIGEGGGQILRSSLALSLVTETPFRLINIRANRDKPGLRRQHLTAVLAAAEIGRAEVAGADVGSRDLTFTPRGTHPGVYHFDIGSAGSTTLVLQAVLPALMTAPATTRLKLEGGTHNVHAPPLDFVQKAFLPLVERMGCHVQIDLQRRGFFPAGGGKLEVTIDPGQLQRIDLPERGKLLYQKATAIVANLPRHIAEREHCVLRKELDTPVSLRVEEDTQALGPGNIVLIEVASQHVTEVFTGFGRRGVPAETVAREAVEEAQRYLASTAPVGPHLADQLLLPMALAGGGSFRTLEPTQHFVTNAEVIGRFLDVRIAASPLADGTFDVTIECQRTP